LIEPANFDALAEQKFVPDKEFVAMFLDCAKSGGCHRPNSDRLEDFSTFMPDGDTVWQKPHGWPQAKQWLA